MSAFGVPITDETLKAMSRYRGKKIGQEDRAREAMRLIHADGKNFKALNQTLELKKDYDGDGLTMCMVYNATGNRVELVSELSQDWYGSVYREEPAEFFENGQWIAFLHTHPTAMDWGSAGARVYRANIDGRVMDYMVAWYCSMTKPFGFEENSAYTKVTPQSDTNPGSSAQKYASKIAIDDSDPVCKSTVSIGGYTTSEFIAILQHKFPPLQ